MKHLPFFLPAHYADPVNHVSEVFQAVVHPGTTRKVISRCLPLKAMVFKVFFTASSPPAGKGSKMIAVESFLCQR